MDHCEELNWNIDHLRNLQKIIVCCLSECISSSLFVRKGKEPGKFTCNLINYSIHVLFGGQNIEKPCKPFFTLYPLLRVFIATTRESVGKKTGTPRNTHFPFRFWIQDTPVRKKVKWIYYFLERTLDTFTMANTCDGCGKKTRHVLATVLDFENYIRDNGAPTAQCTTVLEIRQIKFITEFINRPFRFYYFNLDK